jgi:hypothetical protein
MSRRGYTPSTATPGGLANGFFITEYNNAGVLRNLIGISPATDAITVGDTNAGGQLSIICNSTIALTSNLGNINFTVAAGNNFNFSGGILNVNRGMTLRTEAVTTAAFTCDSAGFSGILLCRRVGAIAITLPTNTQGRLLYIVDAGGNATANNITVTPAAGTISGGANYVININRAGIVLCGDATNTDWVVLAVYNGTAV